MFRLQNEIFKTFLRRSNEKQMIQRLLKEKDCTKNNKAGHIVSACTYHA